MSEERLQRLAVVGTGLMGASVGLAAKRAGVELVTGYDLDSNALAVALKREAIDRSAADLARAVAGAELVVIATPARGIPTLVAAAREAAGRTCTVTDIGSTKGGICAALASEARFVGGHPLCGSESQGPDHARAEMFEGATWFLTPLETTETECYRLVEGFVSSLGAVPAPIDPEVHDRLVALTSHLPHALANLLLNQVGATRVAGHYPLETAGGSLRDIARIAGANPRVWVDIFIENAEALAEALAEHRRRIEELEAALAARDSTSLLTSIEKAAEHRGRIIPAPDARRPVLPRRPKEMK